MTNAYSQAGVDVQAGYQVVDRIKSHTDKTWRPGVLESIGGFGAAFDLGELGVQHPVLISGTDGVGTKLLVAQQAGIHDTIGIDCVAMCVNDIVAQGAEPLYFLDYVATGKTDPVEIEQIVSGIANGCQQAGAALIGGETAEMPGMYQHGQYDLAGFAVGVAERDLVVTGKEIAQGDLLLGLPSSGLHSNGYSLVRKILFEDEGLTVDSVLPDFPGQTLGEVLLEPTRIYVRELLPVFKEGLALGAAHITGGGFVENLPRMLPEGLGAEVVLDSWPIPPIFQVLQQKGNIPRLEMFEIFNMGVGMVVVVKPERLEEVLALVDGDVYQIGTVIGGEGVTFK